MSDRTMAVNTPAALAAMMRQAQCDREFRDKLFERRAIPFGSLASALESHTREIEFPSGVLVQRQGTDMFTISRDGIAYSVSSTEALKLIREHVCPPERKPHVSPHDPDR